MNLVDTHAHLDFADDVDGWIERAKESGVNKIVCVGTSVDSSRKCVEIAEKYSNRHSRESGNPETGSRIKYGMTRKDDIEIYATVGIHAEDGKGDLEKYGSLDKCVEILRKIAKPSFALRASEGEQVQNDPPTLSELRRASSKVVGVGECGFDIRRTTNNLQLTTDQEIKFQRELFEAQIRLAAELGLPLIVHCRNAWDETFELLNRFRNKSGMTGEALRGVFHSWTGDWTAAKKALDLGFYISFSGILTFKNAPDVRDVAKKVPLDRVLLETDSPYLAPAPIRGSQNEPKNVKIIGEFLAELRNIPFSEIASVTSKNAGRLFGIDSETLR